MPYALGPVKEHVRAAAEDIGKRFGIVNIIGVALRSYESYHPRGLALDFMTTDKAKGDALAEYAKSNASAYGVTEVIWWGRIWTVARSGEGWRTYNPPNRLYTATQMHKDHVHLSFSATPGTGVPTQTSRTGSGISCGILLFAATSSVSAMAYAIHRLMGA